ncbi:MAG: methyl-accepting chemotaxis protein [Pseudomonadales bacterium]
MKLIKNLKVLYKFSLVMVVMAVPIALLSVLFLEFKTEGINFAKQEVVGMEYLVPVQNVLKHVSEHRALVSFSYQNNRIKNQLSGKQGEIERAISAVDLVDSKYAEQLSVSSEWSSIKSQWGDLKNNTSRMNVVGSTKAHTVLLNDILSFMESVGDASNLILDPVLDSYYLMDAIVIRLPSAQSNLEGLRNMLAMQEKGSYLSTKEKLDIKVYLNSIKNDLGASQRSLEIAFANNAALKSKLGANLNTFLRDSNAYTDYVGTLIAESSESDPIDYEQAFSLLAQPLVAWDALSDATAAELVAVLNNRADELTADLYKEMSLVVICVLLAFGFGFWVIRSVTTPMSEAIRVFSRIEDGDLSSEIVVKTTDETGQLLRALRDMQNTLGVIDDVIKMLSGMAAGKMTGRITEQYRGKFEDLKVYSNELAEKFSGVVGSIQESASTVKAAADEISQGNNNLSKRTEEQAASLEQTAASMEEITSTIVQNTENARQANDLAAAARTTAEVGGEVVNTAITAMAGINESSKKMADIVSVIDEIAFQTNLLALNASVEAARAGEQGRGFAVVAGEVRNLAGRSATSAKEIKELIEDSLVKVDEGSQLVNKSGDTLQEIVSSVTKVSDIVAEITAASEEQSVGIGEINRAVTQMDSATQQNAALVEEVAAASEAMGAEASDLEGQMAFFEIGSAAGVSRPVNSSVPKQADRRSDSRAFTAPSAKPQSQDKQIPTLKAVGSDDGFWEEF